MLKLALAAAVIAAVPAIASAQSVTTDCYSRKHGGIHCRSTVWPRFEPPVRYNPDGSVDGRDRHYYESLPEQRLLVERNRLDPRKHTPDAQRAKVAELIINRDCPGARRYALATENPTTIERMESFCMKSDAEFAAAVAALTNPAK
jgi:hypothetical protein